MRRTILVAAVLAALFVITGVAAQTAACAAPRTCVYFAAVARPVPPPTVTRTATATQTHTPTATATVGPTTTEIPVFDDIQDGSFELPEAQSPWYQQISVIVRPPLGGKFPEIRARTGQQLVWLGRDIDELVSQRVRVPADRTRLEFYAILRSDRFACRADIGMLFSFDTFTQWIPLCREQQTADWTRFTIDLSAYANQSGNVAFEVFDDSDDVFIDDVAFVK